MPQRTNNQSLVDDFAMALAPAIVVSANALRKCAELATFVGNPSSYANDVVSHLETGYEHTSTRPETQYENGKFVTVNVETTTTEQVNDHTISTALSAARNNIKSVVNTIGDFAARALSIGFVPPSDPFVEILRLRSLSKGSPYVNVDPIRADEIVFNISTYLKLIKAEFNGELNMNGSVVTGTAQLAHVGFSTDGFVDFTADSADKDLISFLMDSDSIKRKLASDALSSFDFTKRVPKIMFTAKYDPDGVDRGSIIGWRRMPDASGYVIRRRDVFSGKEEKISLTNAKALESFVLIKDYVKEWVLSFYDGLSDDKVFAYLDKGVEKDKYYTYRIEAYQNVKNSEESIFDVELSIGTLSSISLSSIEKSMKSAIDLRFEESAGVTIDDISPYPFISKAFYNDNKLDWILAGVNLLAAARRKEDRSNVRGFSYIGSKISFLKEQMDKTQFFVPKDIDDVIENITMSISTYGVSKTLLEILDKTGMLFFFDSKESWLSDSFQKAGDINIESSSKMMQILSAIDPETATVDVSSLMTNISKDIRESSKGMSQMHKPSEIEITSVDVDSNVFSEDFLQYAGSIVEDDDVLDLTTIDGIGKLLRVLRSYYDFSMSNGIIVGKLTGGKSSVPPSSAGTIVGEIR